MNTRFNDNINFLFLDYETTGLTFNHLDNNTDYPIEIGCLLTDSKLTILDTYQNLILSDQLYTKIKDTPEKWPTKYLPAFAVHKIDVKDILMNGKNLKYIINDLNKLINSRKKDSRTKTIIVSDNAQFEFNITKFIYTLNNEYFPFHFCAWDTSFLLESCGVKDPIPAHRAFQDVTLLYKAVIRAIEKTNGFI